MRRKKAKNEGKENRLQENGLHLSELSRRQNQIMTQLLRQYFHSTNGTKCIYTPRRKRANIKSPQGTRSIRGECKTNFSVTRNNIVVKRQQILSIFYSKNRVDVWHREEAEATHNEINTAAILNIGFPQTEFFTVFCQSIGSPVV